MTDAPFKPIEITVKDGKSTLLVDGHDITNGIQGYTLTQDRPTHAELELDLLIVTQHVDVDRRAAVIAVLPDEARTALIAAGWTPPPDGEATDG